MKNGRNRAFQPPPTCSQCRRFVGTHRPSSCRVTLHGSNAQAKKLPRQIDSVSQAKVPGPFLAELDKQWIKKTTRKNSLGLTAGFEERPPKVLTRSPAPCLRLPDDFADRRLTRFASCRFPLQGRHTRYEGTQCIRLVFD